MQFCSELTEAGAIADELLGCGHYAYWKAFELQGEPRFTGLFSNVCHLSPRQLYGQLPPMVARLYDRFGRRIRNSRLESQRVAPYSRLAASGCEWCDLTKVRASDEEIAYLLRHEHFPSQVANMTLEGFAIVVPVKRDIKLDELTRHAEAGLGRNRSKSGMDDFVLSYSEDMLTIPLLRHEETFLKFRDKLPVIFLLKDEIVLVEYDWNPMAFGRRFISEARQVEASTHPHKELYPPDQDCLPTSVRIETILPMPLGKGPTPPPRPYARARGMTAFLSRFEFPLAQRELRGGARTSVNVFRYFDLRPRPCSLAFVRIDRSRTDEAPVSDVPCVALRTSGKPLRFYRSVAVAKCG
ncbi:hypothetical protein B0G80_8773 [Paraburkholderia sp. BL6669N2]|nr:hypothetical protein B0G80_8773 [Paraburkholderia sp. BL6669N2]